MTWQDGIDFGISPIALYITVAFSIIIGKTVSISVIFKYRANINKIKTSPLGLMELLKALNTICDASLLSMLGISAMMILYIRCKGSR